VKLAAVAVALTKPNTNYDLETSVKVPTMFAAEITGLLLHVKAR